MGERKAAPRRDDRASRGASLPSDQPRYLMGVGTPTRPAGGVQRGVDMFDCIIPTKMAQQGYAYTFQGLVRITRMALPPRDEPLDADLRLLRLSAPRPRATCTT